ncbi:MAG: hypothetical protein CSA20_08470 [Deltaproteobacteria bacterium]|nr:MAG: hypothetical protein CSA20_08470 [Deltaproteobacteria bacterium]
MIEIKSKREGFRRCGAAFSTQPVAYPDDRFSDDELAILRRDPMLIVTVKGDDDGIPRGLAAKETIRLVTQASDLSSLDALAEGEGRKSVLEAVRIRRRELEQGGTEA